MSHLGGLLAGRSRDLRQRSVTVDVVEGDRHSARCAEVDQLAGHGGWKGLAALVVHDVSLRAAETVCHCLLSDSELGADCLEVMHAGNYESD